ncbi:MAG: hypothetical protein KAI26_04250 [Nanoarchaeota archaeon]|nr:hypothetical protein [Nanoarchaeota archaeon]
MPKKKTSNQKEKKKSFLETHSRTVLSGIIVVGFIQISTRLFDYYMAHPCEEITSCIACAGLGGLFSLFLALAGYVIKSGG